MQKPVDYTGPQFQLWQMAGSLRSSAVLLCLTSGWGIPPHIHILIFSSHAVLKTTKQQNTERLNLRGTQDTSKMWHTFKHTNGHTINNKYLKLHGTDRLNFEGHTIRDRLREGENRTLSWVTVKESFIAKLNFQSIFVCKHGKVTVIHYW